MTATKNGSFTLQISFFISVPLYSLSFSLLRASTTVENRPSWWQEFWEELFGELDPGEGGVCHQRADLLLPQGGCRVGAVAHGGGHPRLVVRLQQSGHV